jgi:hypothetical protein
MNRDFVEMLSALNETGADFLVVGAHAVAAHGHPRATGDLDIWIRPTSTNARQVLGALKQFGAPISNISLEDLSQPQTVFQIGVSPCRIDILTSITGVDFDQAWENKIEIRVNDLTVFCIGKQDLIQNKNVLVRPQDLADVAALKKF